MKELTVLTKNRGINSAIDPRRQSYTPEDGFEFLEAGVNIDITDGHRIVRRKGFSYQLAGTAAHSLCTHGSKVYCVYGTDLCELSQSLNRTVIRPDMNYNRVRYQGAGDKLFYSNEVVNGFIHNAIDYAWSPPLYVGPDTVHEYVAPPVCKHLSLHRGRIYLSVSNALYYTEALNYLALNKAENFLPFNSDIRMILSVGKALFVADQDTLYTYVGTTPDDFELVTTLQDCVIEDTALVVYSPTILGKIVPGPVGLFTTQNAIYAAAQDGSIFDVTENRLRLPAANSGNAYIANNFYTVLIDA
jgi:hypothetical protein